VFSQPIVELPVGSLTNVNTVFYGGQTHSPNTLGQAQYQLGYPVARIAASAHDAARLM